MHGFRGHGRHLLLVAILEEHHPSIPCALDVMRANLVQNFAAPPFYASTWVLHLNLHLLADHVIVDKT
jgi:hypothetical protein